MRGNEYVELVPIPPVVSFTENVKNGISDITCNACGRVVTAELKHIKEFHS